MEERIYDLVYEVEERHWWFRGRRAVIEALLERTQPPTHSRRARILDAGCGTGRNLELYSRFGRAEGVDPSPQAVEYCRRRGLTAVREGDAQSLPFEDGRFGLIAATDVLEHVLDDAAALREMHRVAAPGASLLVTVPAYEWLWSREDVRLEHHRRYSLGGLRRTAAAAGWEPRFGTYFNLILLPPIAIARKLPSDADAEPELERTSAALDGVLSLPMRLEARLIRWGLRLPAGVSVGLVCRRS